MAAFPKQCFSDAIFEIGLIGAVERETFKSGLACELGTSFSLSVRKIPTPRAPLLGFTISVVFLGRADEPHQVRRCSNSPGSDHVLG